MEYACSGDLLSMIKANGRMHEDKAKCIFK